MSATVAQRCSTVPGVVWGGLAVLIAAFFLLLFDGAPAQAAEDDSSSSGSLLSGIVGTTTSAVTEIANPVVTTLGDTVTAVTSTASDAVSSVPVVGPALDGTTSEALGAVAGVVANTAEKTTDLLRDAPLSQITEPVLDLIQETPLLGDVVEDTGVRDLIDGVVGIVDGAGGGVGGVIDGILPPLVESLDPGATTPELPGEPETPSETENGSPDTATTVAPALSFAVGAGTLTAAASVTLAGSTGTAPDAGGIASVPVTPPAHAPPASPGSSAHAAGGSPHEGARIHAAPFGAPGDSARAPSATDDALPASPVADTDVSPD